LTGERLPGDRRTARLSDFAAVLPIAVITDLLGIPDADSAGTTV
jgi:cytochrome P450